MEENLSKWQIAGRITMMVLSAPLMVLLIFVYFYFIPIVYCTYRYFRKEIFGPMLSRDLKEYAERDWKKRFPNLSLEHCRDQLFSDGEKWRYKNGEWRIQDQVGCTKHSSRLIDNIWHSVEEWTDSKGRVHQEFYRNHNDGQNTPVTEATDETPADPYSHPHS